MRIENRTSEQKIDVLLGLFIDGVLSDSLNWQYPKMDGSSKMGHYMLGDVSETAQMSWSIASAYLISNALGGMITSRTLNELL